MIVFLRFVLLGLGTGALYSLVTQGLVLIYKGSGTLNFAQGALVMVGAYAYYEGYRRSWPVWVCFVFAVGCGASVGVVAHVVILRRMKTSSPLARVIATIGMLVFLQSAVVLRYGVDVRSVPSVLPINVVRFTDELVIGADRLILIAIGVLSTALLWALYRWTSFGRATAAVAENERAAASLGHSPDAIAVTNWAMGGALAALGGAFIAPLTYLQPTQLVLLVIPALAAGLLAEFRSFPLALAGSLVIGVSESLMTRYVRAPGWSQSVPFLLVTVVLVLRGRGLPLRSHVLERLPRVGSGRIRPVRLLVSFAVVIGTISMVLPVRWVDAITVTAVLAILCLSVVVITGYAGQLSLAQYVLAGVGAFVAARLAHQWNWPFLPALLGAVFVTTTAGVVVGLPALRTRGIHLAVVTFGLATLIHSLVLSGKSAGGAEGIAVKPPELFGWKIDAIGHPQRYAVVVVAILFALAIAVTNVRRGATGRRLLAVRSNERAAASVGISVYGAKLFAFALASGVAAVAGVLYSFRNSIVISSQFEVFPSVTVVAMTVLGSVGFIGGAIFGALSLPGGVAAELLRSFSGLDRYLPLAGGVVLLHLLSAGQGGLFEVHHHLVHNLAQRLGRSRNHVGLPVDEGLAGPQVEPDAAPEAVATRITAAPARVEPRTLKIEGVTMRFGGVAALTDVSLSIRPGQVHGLIGPNGAGKTTLIDVVTGFLRPTSGMVTLDTIPINGWRPQKRFRSGLGRSFQSVELFNDLTVLENIAVAGDDGLNRRYLFDLIRPARPALSPAALVAIDEFGLRDILERRPDDLSFGMRRLVAIARTVAGQPSVVLLDEPAAGLDDTETAELALVIRRLADEWGMGVLLVEHNLDMVLAVSDHITVLDGGTVLTAGTPAAIATDVRVAAAYVGDTDEKDTLDMHAIETPSHAHPTVGSPR